MAAQVYIIQWTTGDSDTCYGDKDLKDLLAELGYERRDGDVYDGDIIAGRIIVSK